MLRRVPESTRSHAQPKPHVRRVGGNVQLRRLCAARVSKVVWLAVLAFALGPLLAPAPAVGHARSVSYSGWHLDEDGARVQVRVSLLELSRLGIPLPVEPGLTAQDETEAVGRYLADHLALSSGGERCDPTGPPAARPTDTGWVQYRWKVACRVSGQRTIQTSILLDAAPSHLHFARLTVPAAEGGPTRILERVLSEAAPSWALPSSDATGEGTQHLAGTSVGDYLLLGVEHILSGWDHLAFVLALVLLARSLGEVARLVTGFTVAHSITLALAVLRWVEPQTGPVEAVIGFSVALIAAENGWLLGGRGWAIPGVATVGLIGAAALAAAGIGSLPVLTFLGLALFTASHFGLLHVARDPGLLRVLLAFAFGLVHGFGFAGVLAEMALPTDRLAAALLGFNVGVELGQLAVVALLWPLLSLLRRVANGRPHRIFAELAGAGVCGVGLFWFVTRAFGAAGP